MFANNGMEATRYILNKFKKPVMLDVKGKETTFN